MNMPTLYGEGERAFRRLQEEMVRRIPDQTLFARGELYRGLDLRDRATSSLRLACGRSLLMRTGNGSKTRPIRVTIGHQEWDIPAET